MQKLDGAFNRSVSLFPFSDWAMSRVANTLDAFFVTPEVTLESFATIVSQKRSKYSLDEIERLQCVGSSGV